MGINKHSGVFSGRLIHLTSYEALIVQADKSMLTFPRRDCFRRGFGGLLAGVPAAFQLSSARSADTEQRAAKACIFIWLDGGPSHYETFDPKPDAPPEVRGQFEAIETCLPGVHFSQHLRRLATIADKFSVVRSIRHNQGNHGAGNHYMMTGAPPRIPVGCGAFVSFHPSIGSVVAHERETTEPLPRYFSMPSMSRSGGPNFLGAKYAPFVVADDPNNARFHVRDIALPEFVNTERFVSRQKIRSGVDRLPRLNNLAAGDPATTGDAFYEKSYELVTSVEAQKAFDVHAEPTEIRDRYGRNSFGQRALLARRLVEANVPFVTLYEGGWDHHRNIFPALNDRLPSFDNTIATLLEDLETRGLLETTMLIVLGEFGRTPKINTRAGRDHWSNAMSVLFAGGKSPSGQIIGATDRQGYAAVERVLSPENFVATIYQKLGIDPAKIFHTPQGRPTHLVSDPTPIRELMG